MFSEFVDQIKSFASSEPKANTEKSLGYHSNNKYAEFPPLMSDGRSVTACYQPEAVINNQIKESHGLKTNWQYRNYMTKNADTIREHNFKESCNDVGYFARPIDLQSVSSNSFHAFNQPHLYSSIQDEKKPLGHIDSDLKASYLTREQLNARKIAPSIHPDQVLDAKSN